MHRNLCARPLVFSPKTNPRVMSRDCQTASLYTKKFACSSHLFQLYHKKKNRQSAAQSTDDDDDDEPEKKREKKYQNKRKTKSSGSRWRSNNNKKLFDYGLCYTLSLTTYRRIHVQLWHHLCWLRYERSFAKRALLICFCSKSNVGNRNDFELVSCFHMILNDQYLTLGRGHHSISAYALSVYMHGTLSKVLFNNTNNTNNKIKFLFLLVGDFVIRWFSSRKSKENCQCQHFVSISFLFSYLFFYFIFLYIIIQEKKKVNVAII